MKRDKVIFDLIEAEKKRQTKGLELIASENYVSQNVLQAMGSILTNKYAEGLPGKRYYGGCEIVDQIENLAIDRAKELFGASWANVQPHSGSQANAAVMLALLNPGDAILGFDLAHGGHLTHGSPVNFSGKLYRTYFYGIHPETERIDYEMLAKQAKMHQPRLIICGASAYSRDWDYAKIRQIADEVNAIVLADIAHPAGLIAKNLLNNPLPHCHIVSSTTHKTLRGPRGGLLLMGADFPDPKGSKTAKGEIKTISQLIDAAVFPGTQGGPLEHIIAAKAVAFQEALSNDYAEYVMQIKKNTAKMAELFIEKKYKIISNGTDNHCFLIDLRNQKNNINGKQAEQGLVKAGITVNKNMVPFDNKSPFLTSGIRLGTAAITTRGITEKEIPEIVDLIDQVIQNIDNEKIIQNVEKKVQQLMAERPIFANIND